MINVSNDFKALIDADNRNYISKVTIDFPDGTTLNVTNKDIWEGGISFSNSTSQSNEFTIGSAIINKAKVILNNMYDDFSDYDFYDALVDIQLGLEVNGVVEYMRVGRFTVETPTFNDSLITLECIDNMWKFDKDFKDVPTTNPTTIRELINSICIHCGVGIGSIELGGLDFQVEIPDKDNLNCREVLNYLAQMVGMYCKISPLGNLDLSWYREGRSADFTINHIKNITVSTQPITITGFDVKYGTKEDEVVSVGDDTYKLTITNNPFINTLELATMVSQVLMAKLGGLSLWKYSISALNAPYVEAGDTCTFYDSKGREYHSFISNTSFTYGNAQKFELGMKDPVRNNVVHYSDNAKTIAESKKMVEETVSTYAQDVQRMTEISANSMGFFQTVEKQEDGSSIVYLHNKPKLEESMIIYKQTVDGFFVSQDGGQTYSQGFDAEGNALVNVLSAIGIKFDWARGGTLSLGGENNINGQIMIYNAEGENCGVINNNGIAIFSSKTQTQILMSPVVGFVFRNADGNEFYGLSFDKTINNSPLLHTFKPSEMYTTWFERNENGEITTFPSETKKQNGDDYVGVIDQPLKLRAEDSVLNVDYLSLNITYSQFDLTLYSYIEKGKATGTHGYAQRSCYPSGWEYNNRITYSPNSTAGSASILGVRGVADKTINGTTYYKIEGTPTSVVVQLPDSFKGKKISANIILQDVDHTMYENSDDIVAYKFYPYTDRDIYCIDGTVADYSSITNLPMHTGITQSVVKCGRYNTHLPYYYKNMISLWYTDTKPYKRSSILTSQITDEEREVFVKAKDYQFPKEFFDYYYDYEINEEDATITITGWAVGRISNNEKETSSGYYHDFINMNEFMRFRVMATA